MGLRPDFLAILRKTCQFKIFNFNSYGMSLEEIAKILENAHNGGNEHDSSKIAQETRLKFKGESFGAIKISPKNFFGGNFTGNEPKIDRK